MYDNEIIELFWKRSELAIVETERKYGKYCYYIAYNILFSEQDAEECVNDTYIKAWETMPPKRPERLSAYLGKLIRNISINRYIRDRAKKRSPGTELILDEVGEFVPDPDTVACVSEEIALKDAINGFMETLPQLTRIVFVRRYWYMSPIKDIARDYGFTESNVKVLLLRTKNKFKTYLEKEGIVL